MADKTATAGATPTADVKPSGIVINASPLSPQAGTVNCRVVDGETRVGTCNFDVTTETAAKLAGKSFELKEVPNTP